MIYDRNPKIQRQGQNTASGSGLERQGQGQVYDL